jgi:hypothetical protein
MERLRRFADQQTVIRPADLERLAVPRNYLGRLPRPGWEAGEGGPWALFVC